MVDYNIFVAILAAVAMFMFSIEKFSKQIRQIAGKKLKSILAKLTSNPLKGSLVGAGVTSVVQSSTATTVITVSLINAGLITFYNSLGVIIGANVGTTITTQLVAFKLTTFAPVFILLGFAIRLTPWKYKFIGKPIFYFGMLFFSLSLVSAYVSPISSDPEIIEIFGKISNLYYGILAGFLFTVLVQSSSITTGLAVILVGTSLLTFNQSLGIILGSNIGTTVTALLASIRMSRDAKRAAMAHTIFNVVSVLIILPFAFVFGNYVQSLGGSIEQQVANAHLIFNLGAAVIFLILIKPFYWTVMKIYPERKGKKR